MKMYKRLWCHCTTLICFNISEINIHHRAKEQYVALFMFTNACINLIGWLSSDSGNIWSSVSTHYPFMFIEQINWQIIYKYDSSPSMGKSVALFMFTNACINLIGWLSSDCLPIRILASAVEITVSERSQARLLAICSIVYVH